MTSQFFHNTVQYLSNNKFEAVDGGNLQWSILLPALNGVVMTAISLLYANLVSTTGTQLRARQNIIHQSLNTEVDGIRGLIQLIQYYPERVRDQFGGYLTGYILMLIDELTLGADELRSVNQPLSDYRDELHFLSILPAENEQHTHANILERSYETLGSISAGRTSRVAALQSNFPTLHWVTISTLTAIILLVFLLETDRKVILFLDNFQVRLVWGLLVGTLTAIYCIGIDLSYPFVGTYTVPAEQLLDDNDEILGMICDSSRPKLPRAMRQKLNEIEKRQSVDANAPDLGNIEIPRSRVSMGEEYSTRQQSATFALAVSTPALDNIEKIQWESATDPQSGRSYYYDRNTGESTWVKPEEYTAQVDGLSMMWDDTKSATPPAGSAFYEEYLRTRDLSP